MDQYSALIPISHQLHQTFVNLFYLMLPVAFALAIALDWFRNPQGSPDFLDTFKRAVISTLLVTAYPEISSLILSLSSGIADRISDLSGLDSMIQMAAEKTKGYSMSPFSIVLGFNDLLIAIISFLSYLILYFARFITVALFHFIWMMLYILSPLLILLHLFRGTSQITQNLFRNMIEVSCYKIIWAVLSVMITHLPLGNAYSVEGNYFTVIFLNFIIAFAMLFTPLIVKSLIGSGLTSASESLQRAASLPIQSFPMGTAMNLGQRVFSSTVGQTGNLWNSLQGRWNQPYAPVQNNESSPYSRVSQSLPLDRELKPKQLPSPK